MVDAGSGGRGKPGASSNSTGGTRLPRGGGHEDRIKALRGVGH